MPSSTCCQLVGLLPSSHCKVNAATVDFNLSVFSLSPPPSPTRVTQSFSPPFLATLLPPPPKKKGNANIEGGGGLKALSEEGRKEGNSTLLHLSREEGDSWYFTRKKCGNQQQFAQFHEFFYPFLSIHFFVTRDPEILKKKFSHFFVYLDRANVGWLETCTIIRGKKKPLEEREKEQARNNIFSYFFCGKMEVVSDEEEGWVGAGDLNEERGSCCCRIKNNKWKKASMH